MTVQTLPKAGTYAIDPTHTQIELTARHLMVSKVRGSFKEFSGAITIGESPAESSVEVSIGAASIDTGVEDRDSHLRSPDFLDAENHPTISFASTAVDQDGASFRLVGDLTIKDVTRPITLDMEYLGANVDPWGNEKVAFAANGTFDREAWGLAWNVALEAGGWLVSKHFEIDIAVQAA